MKQPTVADLKRKEVVDTTGETIIADAEEVLGAKLRERRAKPKFCILVDTREQAELSPHFDGAECTYEKATLPTGDYSLKGATHLLSIERKSLSDLTQCCGKDRERFLDQMARLAAYPHKFLVIERPEAEIHAQAYRSQIKPQSVIATLMAIQVKYGVCVVFCDGVKDCARKVQWLCWYVSERQRKGMYEQQEGAA